MTVVSNMSPLHYLILIDCDRILPVLYRQVLTPLAVINEMKVPSTPMVVRRWADAPPAWLKIVEPANIEDIPRRHRASGRTPIEPMNKGRAELLNSLP
jgi:predicted nucleic acid-binding protein